jgi:PPP family 3-phenylpropionic acid transporter
LYTALYAAFGVISPFLPVFLSDRGLAAEQIAAVMASGMAVRLLSGPLPGTLQIGMVYGEDCSQAAPGSPA